MAGNTKFMGFGPANSVELARWGEKARATLSPASINELKKVCYSVLPKEPPRRPSELHPDYFASTYDESMGRVRLEVAPIVAKQLAELLLLGAQNVKQQNAKLAEACAQELISCYEEHLDYLNTDEPGVKE